MRSTYVHALALIALAIFGSTALAQSDDRLKLEDCVVPGTEMQARCGSYTVFENRSARSGRTIDLNIIILPARNGEARPDPVFYLVGGPGVGATRAARGSGEAVTSNRTTPSAPARAAAAAWATMTTPPSAAVSRIASCSSPP